MMASAGETWPDVPPPVTKIRGESEEEGAIIFVRSLTENRMADGELADGG